MSFTLSPVSASCSGLPLRGDTFPEQCDKKREWEWNQPSQQKQERKKFFGAREGSTWRPGFYFSLHKGPKHLNINIVVFFKKRSQFVLLFTEPSVLRAKKDSDREDIGWILYPRVEFALWAFKQPHVGWAQSCPQQLFVWISPHTALLHSDCHSFVNMY